MFVRAALTGAGVSELVGVGVDMVAAGVETLARAEGGAARREDVM